MTEAITGKQIELVRRRDDVSAADFARGLLEHGRLVAEHHAKVAKVAVNVVQTDQALFERIGLRIRPIDWHGLVHIWFDEPERALRYPHSAQVLADQLLSIASESTGWWVDENEAWLADRDWPAGVVTSGVKQMSLVTRRPDLSFDDFVARYRNHVNVAKIHHIGCWQYVQNFVAAPASQRPAPTIDGISELWFRSIDDMVERFYTAPNSPDAVRDDTSGFIDFANTRSYLTVETIVFG